MQEELNEFIERALHEDVRDGDHTSLACIPNDAMGKTQLLVKENGILAGMALASLIFQKVDDRIVMNNILKDGEFSNMGHAVVQDQENMLTFCDSKDYIETINNNKNISSIVCSLEILDELMGKNVSGTTILEKFSNSNLYTNLIISFFNIHSVIK